MALQVKYISYDLVGMQKSKHIQQHTWPPDTER